MTRHFCDVAIVGGGLAGSLAASMLGRAGYEVTLIDPDEQQRPEFRCEKLDDSQLALLEQTGLADHVLPATRRDGEVWVVRYGRLIDRRPGGRAGIMYHDLVNAVRSSVPVSVRYVPSKVAEITSGPAGNSLTLTSGEMVAGKLIVLATGLNPRLSEQLCIERRLLSRRHSLSLGFDLAPAQAEAFDFPALTYFPESPDQLLAYLTLFPVPGAMRANLFAYWEADDPRLRQFRHDPVSALDSYLPYLKRFTGPNKIVGNVEIRPVDLIRADDPARPGIVLVGDAYSTSCPAAGTGANKVLTDVVQLCNVHVPDWLHKPHVWADDVAQFYADPVKQACEQASYDYAMKLKERSTASSLTWRCWRGARFAVQTAVGGLRQVRRRLPASEPV